MRWDLVKMGWIIPTIFAGACLILWPFLGLTLSPNALWLFPLFMGLYCCHLTPTFVQYRLKNDYTWPAIRIKRLAESVALFFKGAIPFTLVSFSFATYSTLAVRLRLPLRDAELAKLDAFLGFQWLDFLVLVGSSKIASAILVVIYHSFVPQFVFLIAVLSFMQMQDRISEFISLYGLTALITAVIATVLPAAGAHVYFAPHIEQFSNFTYLSGMWHYHLLLELRTASITSFDPFHLEGMVTFPSFHAIAAVLTAYAARYIRFVALPILALNILMIVSAIPEGGHYLIDVVAGVLISVACIIIHANFYWVQFPSQLWLTSTKRNAGASVYPAAASATDPTDSRQ